MRMLFVCSLLVCAAAAGSAQEFEVASVKPNKSLANSSNSHSDQGRYTATNVSLRRLIIQAYGLKDYQVSAPGWLSSEKFDVAAKYPEALPTQDRQKYLAGLQAMMQKMLVDRFKLETHRETRPASVYGLVVGKTGIKFKEVPDAGNHNSNSNNTHYVGKCIDMDTLSTFLSSSVDLPVLNMTELKAYYDLTLDWVPEERHGDGDKPVGDPLAGPTLMMALQDQLGLKLELRKAPIEFLVVDKVERVPTEN
jgi:uncharacterized protein (TIGR03435 family)